MVGERLRKNDDLDPGVFKPDISASDIPNFYISEIESPYLAGWAGEKKCASPALIEKEIWRRVYLADSLAKKAMVSKSTFASVENFFPDHPKSHHEYAYNTLTLGRKKKINPDYNNNPPLPKEDIKPLLFVFPEKVIFTKEGEIRNFTKGMQMKNVKFGLAKLIFFPEGKKAIDFLELSGAFDNRMIASPVSMFFYSILCKSYGNYGKKEIKGSLAHVATTTVTAKRHTTPSSLYVDEKITHLLEWDKESQKTLGIVDKRSIIFTASALVREYENRKNPLPGIIPGLPGV